MLHCSRGNVTRFEQEVGEERGGEETKLKEPKWPKFQSQNFWQYKAKVTK